MDFIEEKLLNYALLHSQKEPELLQKLWRETNLEVLQPRMLTSPLQGRLLSLLSKLLKPEKILEIGTYTGYSALCLCEGLSEKGELHTIDKNEELNDIQNKYFNNSLHRNKIIQYTGKALDIIPQLNYDFDLIFLDADKENYINYLELLVPKLKSGGLLLTDNVLWSGKVLMENPDKETKIIKKYNYLINGDSRLESILLPIRDGLTLSRKI
tara:strand:- start:821 stop:1456 length:636 start_codon:yes stop_codon:yes gene_type:complete